MIFLFYGTSIAHLEPELQPFEVWSIFVGISAWVSVADFKEVFAQQPQIIVCNVEFLSSKKVAKGLFLKQLGLLF